MKFKVWDYTRNEMLPKNGVVSEIKFNQNADPVYVGIYEYVQIDEEGNGDWDGFDLTEGQFELLRPTDLQDRNGVWLYEGDIITNLNNTGLYLIEWESSMFIVKSLPKSMYKTHEPLGYDMDDNFISTDTWATKIGSKYENPELLKSEEVTK